jgi:hypothetical protein
MAWVRTTVNRMAVATEAAAALPASATTEYSSVITFLPILRRANEHEYATISATVSTVTGTNVDIGLYGSVTAAGTVKFLLLDAPIADFTTGASAVTKCGTIDLKAYPAPYYFIGWTADANESANTIALTVMRS